MSSLILKRNLIGQNSDDFDVLEDGVVVGRILFISAAGAGRDVGEWTQWRHPPRRMVSCLLK